MLSAKVRYMQRPGRPEAAREAPAGARDRESGATVARNALYLVIGQGATTVLAIILSAALGRSLGA